MIKFPIKNAYFVEKSNIGICFFFEWVVSVNYFFFFNIYVTTQSNLNLFLIKINYNNNNIALIGLKLYVQLHI